MPKASLSRNQLNLVLFVIGILVFRLVLLGAIPLLDKTEARYSEIARLMFETGEWAVLQIDYGVPFWAKPPLSTWTSAMTYYLFGINEFAARLPYFLINLLLIIITLSKQMRWMIYPRFFGKIKAVIKTMQLFMDHQWLLKVLRMDFLF